jgi:2-C-methyl-D-erythritol 2,4-cyclodiphosphate synthase
MRIGFGYDVHRLERGLPLMIGGVSIPSDKGCVAHSDGDVLVHAICDALLGAANMGDIGKHFPNTDPAWKDIPGRELLRQTLEIIASEGYHVVNVDSTVCLQQPKLSSHIPEMKKILGSLTGTSAVSVKATTTEKLGFTGREEGIAAYAVVLIDQ